MSKVFKRISNSNSGMVFSVVSQLSKGDFGFAADSQDEILNLIDGEASKKSSSYNLNVDFQKGIATVHYTA